ncbi:galactose/glucose ABC transporter substrate-binding protein MglB [Aerococcaceae bacterium NML191292]|nr:galactose/glucose ABC transporter substrate-binding protein MglB [Aerococcaceae bacterium NML191292]MCW6660879.1 galactose/glucose ABC transporter substrate-binding protein MglB [Aerococcaceae bacterium NML201209]MCW6662984.1 galactose/glucose ABC transporter substrate-binding protein MglB [Aerococcaceae bacterium NML190073]MCW6666509.1 galactose/glucose ABC transporter substrate-binding protein MglB [Aerococcaceae bacterium NML190938]MCW6674786.1 galactose/glucose ABC transporter substrate-
MKKLSKVLLAVFLLLAYIVPAVTVVRAEDKDVKIGVAFYKYDDAYMSSVRVALEKVAKEHDNVELLLNDSQNDQAKQNDQIDVMIQKGVDVLLINVVDTGAAETVIQKAKDANIPLILFNREPATEVVKAYDKARFVGTTAKEAGIIQGQMMVELWNSDKKFDRNGNGTLDYVMLIGDAENPEAIARTKFSVDTLTEAGIKVNKLGDQVANWDADKANTAVSAWLSKDGDNIDIVIANNDSMASGAIAALQAAGFNTEKGTEKYIPVYGVDATDEAVDLISRGIMTGTVKQDAEGMAKAVFALGYNAAQGRDFVEGTDYKYDETEVSVRIPYQPYVSE